MPGMRRAKAGRAPQTGTAQRLCLRSASSAVLLRQPRAVGRVRQAWPFSSSLPVLELRGQGCSGSRAPEPSQLPGALSTACGAPGPSRLGGCSPFHPYGCPWPPSPLSPFISLLSHLWFCFCFICAHAAVVFLALGLGSSSPGFCFLM